MCGSSECVPVVRIVRSWKDPDWLRQTPEGKGRWGNVQFTEEAIPNPDFVIVCNGVEKDTRLLVDSSRVWLVLQEPPIRDYCWFAAGYDQFAEIFGPHPELKERVGGHWQHGCLPWHVGKGFDELACFHPSAKTVNLTWITSNARAHRGHRQRMAFLEKLQRRGVPLELHGRGFRPIADKWDALAAARYGLAVENFSGFHYWTEKVADCFLAGVFPLYWGCTNLADYFPAESFVWIDIEDRHAPMQVAEIVQSSLAEERREVLMEARRRVMEEHQFFSHFAARVRAHLAQYPRSFAEERTINSVPAMIRYKMTTPWIRRLLNGLHRRLLSATQ